MSNESNQPKEVYLGLPEHLKDRVYWIQKGRTNTLSYIPAYYDVITVRSDDSDFPQVRGYNNIHYPSLYIRFFYDGVIYVVYVRKHKKDNTTSEFIEVWNKTSNKTLKEALEEFEGKDPDE
jgi:hypothetical protein